MKLYIKLKPTIIPSRRVDFLFNFLFRFWSFSTFLVYATNTQLYVHIGADHDAEVCTQQVAFHEVQQYLLGPTSLQSCLRLCFVLFRLYSFCVLSTITSIRNTDKPRRAPSFSGTIHLSMFSDIYIYRQQRHHLWKSNGYQYASDSSRRTSDC